MKVTIRDKIAPSWQKFNDPDAEYLLVPLTELQLNDVRPYATVKKSSVHISSAGLELIAGYCLRGWRGVTDQNGQSVPMPRDAEERLAILSQDMTELYALAWYVLTSQTPTDAETKK